MSRAKARGGLQIPGAPSSAQRSGKEATGGGGSAAFSSSSSTGGEEGGSSATAGGSGGDSGGLGGAAQAPTTNSAGKTWLRSNKASENRVKGIQRPSYLDCHALLYGEMAPLPFTTARNCLEGVAALRTPARLTSFVDRCARFEPFVQR
jgi:hypothetical protein